MSTIIVTNSYHRNELSIIYLFQFNTSDTTAVVLWMTIAFPTILPPIESIASQTTQLAQFLYEDGFALVALLAVHNRVFE